MTSWETSSSWYDKIVGDKGHYYHQHVIIPGILKLLQLKPGHRLLDLACGQGVLARYLPQNVDYVGIDASFSLIQEAQKKSHHHFIVGDVSKPLNEGKFTHVSIILALQNIEEGGAVVKNAAVHLEKDGKCIIVLNHPCFRIPRQSAWGVDETKKLQYRRIDRYLSPLKIPIQTHPGTQNSEKTWTFHHCLSDYTRWLQASGFVIEVIEEWVSNKKSLGGQARMENRSREEFPLFLAILVKLDRKFVS